MRTVLALVLALAATPAFAEDIITQDQVQGVPHSEMDAMRNKRLQKIATALKATAYFDQAFADAKRKADEGALEEAKHWSIAPLPRCDRSLPWPKDPIDALIQTSNCTP